MALYTKQYLREVASHSNNFIVEQQRLYSQTSASKQFDVFLSHSQLDRNEVYGAYVELKKRGLEVYVDWIVDAHMDRSQVTRESAALIRNRLKNSKSLLLAFSANAQLSKWIPWELGYVDGHTSRCALFPVSETSETNFHRTEYLKLYPYAKLADLGYSPQMIITESSNEWIQFDPWLKENRSPQVQSKSVEYL